MASAVADGKPMQDAVAARLRHPVRVIATVTGLYVGVFAALTALYDGLQRTAGWF